LIRSHSVRAAFRWSAALAVACSLRPLDDLETSRGSLAVSSCPDEMQQVAFDDGATFCIDRRETTRAEYDEFLAAPAPEMPPTARDPALCPADADVEPGGGADCRAAYEPGVDPDRPVACVDLCAAMAYCGFRGKRLCGGRGGERVDEQSVNIPTEDEWFLACTGGTGRLYPYAATFEPRRCNINSAALEPVDSARGCETPDHIQQLSGNVAEWVLICKEFPRLDQTRCLVRGGDYRTVDPTRAECHQTPRGVEDRDGPAGELPTERSAGIGIRCCKD
jgi:sulfatase modifying factor 1